MGLFDISLMILIVGGALWLLSYSLWKKKGCCGSCNGNVCKGG